LHFFNERDEQSCHVNLPRDLNKLKAFTANRFVSEALIKIFLPISQAKFLKHLIAGGR